MLGRSENEETVGRAVHRAALVICLAGVGGAVSAQEDPPASGAPVDLFTVSGQVVDSVRGDYVLQHDGGTVDVNFSGWPRELPGGGAIMGIGDIVTVTGWMDAEFVRTGSLGAVAVYVEDRRAFFSLGEAAAAEAGMLRPLILPGATLGRDGDGDLVGTIVTVQEDGFVLGSGGVEVSVDTSALFYNPFDQVGAQRLEVGDVVHVRGGLGARFAEEPVMQAESVTSVYVIGAAG